MNSRKIQTIANFQNKDIALNMKFLDADFVVLEGNLIKMNPIVDTEQILEYTRNGMDYYNVNNNLAQTADGSYTFRFPVSAGDLFNVRIKGGAAVTVSSFIAELFLEA